MIVAIVEGGLKTVAMLDASAATYANVGCDTCAR
jgi:hypothetical protein